MTVTSDPAQLGLRERKKQQTRQLLLETTVALIAERGLNQVRVEEICEHAAVGRATFFRYFDSKESAFVEGIHADRLASITSALARQPPDEAPLVALRAAVLSASRNWRQQREKLLLEAEIRSSSAAVQARASAAYFEWEFALSKGLTKHFSDLKPNDMRSSLLAAVCLTAIRKATDHWLAKGANESYAPYCHEAFDAVQSLAATLK